MWRHRAQSSTSPKGERGGVRTSVELPLINRFENSNAESRFDAAPNRCGLTLRVSRVDRAANCSAGDETPSDAAGNRAAGGEDQYLAERSGLGATDRGDDQDCDGKAGASHESWCRSHSV